MIKSRKELAIALTDNNKVEISRISKRLSRIVDMWISSGSIKKENNSLIGNF